MLLNSITPNIYRKHMKKQKASIAHLDFMVVLPEDDNKEEITNVNRVDTYKSFLMLFNTCHQVSESTYHL